jgi:hypothetical protein
MSEQFLQTFEDDDEVATPRATKDNDAPIANAEDIPLFEDADKRGFRTAAYIKVTKIDPPNAGYKGEVPLNSTLETIAQLFGNGLFNFAVCNHKHKTLRTQENVKISVQGSVTTTAIAPSQGKDTSSQTVIDILDKFDKQSRQINDQVRTNSKEYTDLVKTTTEASAERERLFLTTVNKNNQEFFQGMLASQAQNFQQLMAMMVMGHQQTIESIRATQAQNNPLAFVEVLTKGLQMGRDMGSDDPDWLKALGVGKSMVGDLAEIAKTARTNPKILTNGNKEAEAKNKGKEAPKERPLTREEIIELIKLKKSLLNRGIELEAMLKDANKHYTSSGVDDDDNTNLESETESDDSKSGNVVGEES